MKILRAVTLCLGVLHCGGGEPSGASDQGSGDGSATDPAGEVARNSAGASTPGAAAAPAAAGIDVGPTVLQWDETVAAGPEYGRARTELLARCDAAIGALDGLEVPVAFSDEGLLASDPKRQASEAIWKVLYEKAPTVGYCARLANPLQKRAAQSVIAYVGKLSTVYKGGYSDPTTNDDDPGNPINELRLLPVIFAADMTYGAMDNAQRKATATLLLGVESRVEAFIGKLPAADKSRKNNWMMHALALRLYSAMVARDAAKTASLTTSFNAFVVASYTTPAGWRPSTCRNLGSIGAYGSVDLQERDAFRYHLAGLKDVLEIETLRPGILTPAALARATTALELTRPYVTGEKVHDEFVCSTVQLDRDRAAAGEVGFSGPFVAATQKYAFRYGRIAIPSSRAWTDALATSAYTEWHRVLVAGRGDKIAY